MMIIQAMQVWMVSKRIIKMHRPAADNRKNLGDAFLNQKICYVVCHSDFQTKFSLPIIDTSIVSSRIPYNSEIQPSFLNHQWSAHDPGIDTHHIFPQKTDKNQLHRA